VIPSSAVRRDESQAHSALPAGFNVQTAEIQKSRFRPTLVVGALGVVYGDIGTSPLYALRECFNPPHGIEPTPQNVFGIVSLVFWSLTLIVTIKYLSLVMRADNRGEGGILALLALAVAPGRATTGRRAGMLLALGIFGGALLYGDGMLTPAVTVLGAIEGLEIATPIFRHWVIPLSVAVLIGLFSLQRFGTGRVGRWFGPLMLGWFLVLAILGMNGITKAPRILGALSPHHALMFLGHEGHVAFVVLGSIFLVVTGAEALYADMGHFGRKPIQQAWLAIVFPALLLNYLGEGALLLTDPSAARSPFFLLAPEWAVVPLVILSTVAAVVASQALISGAFSLTMQAVQMGYLPRLIIQHTSHSERGQIFMPQVNRLLMIACIGLVIGFGSSSRLAGAYGIAVSLTMLCTTVLFHAAARRLWGWSGWRATLVCGLFLTIEACFAGANALKIWQGGWFPLAVGSFMFVLMTTWHRGRSGLRGRLADSYLPLELFLVDLENTPVHRVPGTAIFMSSNPTGTPIALLHNLRHNQVLHQRVVILTVENRDTPFVADSERLSIETLRPQIYRVTGRYGFMEQPSIPALLDQCVPLGLEIEMARTTFFLSRETVIPNGRTGLPAWRGKLFAALSRNAQSATAFFQLPPNRVVELGVQVEV
jgi:KUP system potassium uptake protein